jgi:hypothetical protein
MDNLRVTDTARISIIWLEIVVRENNRRSRAMTQIGVGHAALSVLASAFTRLPCRGTSTALAR